MFSMEPVCFYNPDLFLPCTLFSWVVNRRLDEWVNLEQLDLSSVETDVDDKVEDKVISRIPLIPSS